VIQMLQRSAALLKVAASDHAEMNWEALGTDTNMIP
jgi:hypothetical protein